MVNSGTLKVLGKERLCNLCITISLVGLVWTGMVWGFGHTWHIHEHGELPLGSSGTGLATPLYLWNTSESIILLPALSLKSALHKLAPRNNPNASPSLVSVASGAVFKSWRDSHRYIAGPNIVLMLAGYQACQYLDIPPPSSRLIL